MHDDAIHRCGDHIIPTARYVLYAAMLTGSPCLVEPVNELLITFLFYLELWYNVSLWALFLSLFIHGVAAVVAFLTLRKHAVGRYILLTLSNRQISTKFVFITYICFQFVRLLWFLQVYRRIFRALQSLKVEGCRDVSEQILSKLLPRVQIDREPYNKQQLYRQNQKLSSLRIQH